MERSNFCMEWSDFDYGAKWLGEKWTWGEMTVIPRKAQTVDKEIHFPTLESEKINIQS